jgi:hypothetical protein
VRSRLKARRLKPSMPAVGKRGIHRHDAGELVRVPA